MNTVDGHCVREFIHVMDLADAQCEGFYDLNDSLLISTMYFNVGTWKWEYKF